MERSFSVIGILHWLRSFVVFVSIVVWLTLRFIVRPLYLLWECLYVCTCWHSVLFFHFRCHCFYFAHSHAAVSSDYVYDAFDVLHIWNERKHSFAQRAIEEHLWKRTYLHMWQQCKLIFSKLHCLEFVVA